MLGTLKLNIILKNFNVKSIIKSLCTCANTLRVRGYT